MSLEFSTEFTRRFRLGAKLGSGSMGVVYAARDEILGRLVAVKVLNPALMDEEGRARFFEEARVTAALRHEGIVTLFEAGLDGELPYMVLELIQGFSLRRYIGSKRRISLKRSLQLAGLVADALGYAHGLNVVHRDVKPDNIMIAGQNRVKLADFGIARAVGGRTCRTVTGIVLGTVAYMAPEQIAQQAVSPSVDIYALGVVLYEMIAGKPPFRGSTATIAHAHLQDDPPPLPAERLEGLDEVSELVSAALAKDPADRISSADEFAAWCRRLEDDSRFLTASVWSLSSVDGSDEVKRAVSQLLDDERESSSAVQKSAGATVASRSAAQKSTGATVASRSAVAGTEEEDDVTRRMSGGVSVDEIGPVAVSAPGGSMAERVGSDGSRSRNLMVGSLLLLLIMTMIGLTLFLTSGRSTVLKRFEVTARGGVVELVWELSSPALGVVEYRSLADGDDIPWTVVQSETRGADSFHRAVVRRVPPGRYEVRVPACQEKGQSLDGFVMPPRQMPRRVGLKWSRTDTAELEFRAVEPGSLRLEVRDPEDAVVQIIDQTVDMVADEPARVILEHEVLFLQQVELRQQWSLDGMPTVRSTMSLDSFVTALDRTLDVANRDYRRRWSNTNQDDEEWKAAIDELLASYEEGDLRQLLGVLASEESRYRRYVPFDIRARFHRALEYPWKLEMFARLHGRQVGDAAIRLRGAPRDRRSDRRSTIRPGSLDLYEPREQEPRILTYGGDSSLSIPLDLTEHEFGDQMRAVLAIRSRFSAPDVFLRVVVSPLHDRMIHRLAEASPGSSGRDVRSVSSEFSWDDGLMWDELEIPMSFLRWGERMQLRIRIESLPYGNEHRRGARTVEVERVALRLEERGL